MESAALESRAAASVPIPWRRIAGWFVLSRLVMWTVAALALEFAPKGKFFVPPATPLHWFKLWDANWYLDVVHRSYAYDPLRMSNVNFLPLYPFFVRIASWVLPSVELAGYLVSNLLCLAAAGLLWRLSASLAGGA
ncbi:MAG TPA: hypothetical protein VM029_22985, partial [Opitutaceae bacterium]|nr:hypothetical protein [Opitutaceae bacterium]